MYMKVRNAIDASALINADTMPMPNIVSVTIHNIISYKIKIRSKELPLTLSEYISMGFALINTIFIAILTYDSTPEERSRTETVSFACLLVFTIDCAIRLTAYFPRQYFASWWNILDFVVVMMGWLDLVVPGIPAVQFMRIFRMLRIIKGTNMAELLEKTLNNYLAFLNSIFLLLLMFFAFAVVAVQLFGELELNGALNETANFRSVPKAMVTFFMIVTTEGWTSMLIACSNTENCGGPGQGECGNRVIATTFFCTFMACCFYVCLNLLLAVIVDVVMDDTTKAEAQTLELFATLKQEWTTQFGENTSKISFAHFIEFLGRVPRTLTGLQRESRFPDMVHVLVSLQIPISSSMEVYYTDVVNGFAWRRFHIEIKTYGRIVEETLMSAISAEGFSVGEAYCAEVLQTAWREFRLKQLIGQKQFMKLCHQVKTRHDLCSIPSQRSVVGAIGIDAKTLRKQPGETDDMVVVRLQGLIAKATETPETGRLVKIAAIAEATSAVERFLRAKRRTAVTKQEEKQHMTEPAAKQ
jgi:hypothetical protein